MDRLLGVTEAAGVVGSEAKLSNDDLLDVGITK
jgi:hypothetical protein